MPRQAGDGISSFLARKLVGRGIARGVGLDNAREQRRGLRRQHDHVAIAEAVSAGTVGVVCAGFAFQGPADAHLANRVVENAGAAAGAIGGLLNAIMDRDGLALPVLKDVAGSRVVVPGFIGTIVVGAIAALVSEMLDGNEPAI